MFKIFNVGYKVAKRLKNQKQIRTFLSQSYYCNEIWNERLSSPLLQKINLDLLYHELDQVFQKTRRISPVDVDIFASAVKDDLFIDELLDLVHKLRLTPDTKNTLNSTSHSVIRALLEHNRTNELLQVLDDRLNYGLFLDDYTANILMDAFWKQKNYVAGSVIASQIMLQEDFNHPISRNLAILHCFYYLLKPEEWPQPTPKEEPEEEVKIRVKYLRNPYNDGHFDLREPQKIVGKTLAMACKGRDDPVHASLRIIGLILLGEEKKARQELEVKKIDLIEEIVELLPEDMEIKQELKQKPMKTEDVQTFLQKQVSGAVDKTSEQDIATQSSLFSTWETERLDALEAQKRRVLIAEKLSEMEKLKQNLKDKEQKLWFFENEENIELTIEESSVDTPTAQTKEKQKKDNDDNYVPPEVIPKRNS